MVLKATGNWGGRICKRHTDEGPVSCLIPREDPTTAPRQRCLLQPVRRGQKRTSNSMLED